MPVVQPVEVEPNRETVSCLDENGNIICRQFMIPIPNQPPRSPVPGRNLQSATIGIMTTTDLEIQMFRSLPVPPGLRFM